MSEIQIQESTVGKALEGARSAEMKPASRADTDKWNKASVKESEVSAAEVSEVKEEGQAGASNSIPKVKYTSDLEEAMGKENYDKFVQSFCQSCSDQLRRETARFEQISKENQQ